MLSAKIAELQVNLSKVDRQLKASQVITGKGANISALNKLKKALFYITEACRQENEVLLGDAERAILEALYISCESEAYYYLETFRSFANRWEKSRIIVREVEPEWRVWTELFDELARYIVLTRQDQHIYAEVLQGSLDRPRKICNALRNLEQDLIKKENDYFSDIKNSRLNIALIIFGIVFATAVSFGIYYLQKNDSSPKGFIETPNNIAPRKNAK